MLIQLLTTTDRDIWINPDHAALVEGVSQKVGDEFTRVTLITGQTIALMGKPTLIVDLLAGTA